MTLYPITFHPLFKDRVWGGRRLAELFGKPLPTDVPIGESWEITDRPEGVSEIRNGPLAGRDLRWLMATHGAALLGRPVADGERFPWLVKLLDASDDLSLQVHPPAHRAAALRGEPKTELWYFADTAPDARIYVGLKPGVTRELFEERVAGGTVADSLHVLRPRRGDAMFVPSGRVHALGAGTVVFEIQQNSDTTFRVFDWNRLGLDGRPRELHVGPCLQSIDFDDTTPGLVEAPWEERPPVTRRPLVRHAVFEVDECRLDHGGLVPEPRRAGGCAVLAVVSGRLHCRHAVDSPELSPGDVVLLPASMEPAVLEAEAGTTLLRVTPPPGPAPAAARC